MAAVKWSAISGYVEEVFAMKGRIERSDALAIAEADHASDDVVDALDAIGSRLFKTVEETKTFLTAQGYVQK